MTELEIRTPRLEDATFLLPFRGRSIAAGLRNGLRSALRKGGQKSVASLADEVASALGLSRPDVLPGIWTMVAEFEVAVDLDRPLTMSKRSRAQAEGAEDAQAPVTRGRGDHRQRHR